MQNVKLGYRAIIEVANAVCLLKATLPKRQSRTQSLLAFWSARQRQENSGDTRSRPQKSCGSACSAHALVLKRKSNIPEREHEIRSNFLSRKLETIDDSQ